MPLYEYQCDVCATRFERIQKFSDPPIESCPACQGAVRKLLSSPAIQFKGSGWYITDYAKKPAAGKDESKGSTDAGSKSDAAPAGSSADASASSTASTDSNAAKPSTGVKPAST